jgi:hypothetical protein
MNKFAARFNGHAKPCYIDMALSERANTPSLEWFFLLRTEEIECMWRREGAAMKSLYSAPPGAHMHLEAFPFKMNGVQSKPAIPHSHEDSLVQFEYGSWSR